MLFAIIKRYNIRIKWRGWQKEHIRPVECDMVGPSYKRISGEREREKRGKKKKKKHTKSEGQSADLSESGQSTHWSAIYGWMVIKND